MTAKPAEKEVLLDKIYMLIRQFENHSARFNLEPKRPEFIYLGQRAYNQAKAELGNKNLAYYYPASIEHNGEMKLWQVPVRLVLDDPEHVRVS